MFPRLFQIGNFSLATYGVLAAAGLIIALFTVIRFARHYGVDPDKAWTLGILCILAAMVGAKLLLIVNAWDYYTANPGQILQAAGVFSGGLLLGFAVAWIYIRRNRMPLLKTFDVFAPGIALGHAVGRLGCFAAGCCYGKPTDLPWGVVFTNPLARQFADTPLGVHLHPTQIYESLVELGNFALLAWLFPRKRFDGEIMGTYLFVYGFARYFLEFVRADPERGSVFGGMMTATQLLSIFFVIMGGALWVQWHRDTEPGAVPA